MQTEPLSLMNLARLKIKQSLVYLDVDLINRLPLPRQLNKFLAEGLAPGLKISYERAKMNKRFNISK